MKEATLHSLITAKSIFEEAESLCHSGITHSATAGLILLQDALELIFLACINELGIDEASKIEKMSFDQIVGALQQSGVSVPKSGTLKALNKNRVLAKHYGQLVLPETVRGYLDASHQAIDSVLDAVIGKRLAQIFLTDLLMQGESRSMLEEAVSSYTKGDYLDSLMFIRRAFFLEIEIDYSIHEYKDDDTADLFGFFKKYGRKAPVHTKSSKWISDNVREPTGYVQVDTASLRSSAVEWGVNTNQLLNLMHLTPRVFRAEPTSEWCTSYPAGFVENSANKTNAQYCLDSIIAIIRKKQMHAGAAIPLSYSQPFSSPQIYLYDEVHQSASLESPVVHRIEPSYVYQISNIVTGFDGSTKFYRLSGHPAKEAPWSEKSIYGYLAARPESNLDDGEQ
jgi:hypothetical protein